jgi:hypothetical protein
MWLARMEIEEVLNAMLDRISRIEFAGGSAVIPRAPESSRLGQLMLKVA